MVNENRHDERGLPLNSQIERINCLERDRGRNCMGKDLEGRVIQAIKHPTIVDLNSQYREGNLGFYQVEVCLTSWGEIDERSRRSLIVLARNARDVPDAVREYIDGDADGGNSERIGELTITRIHGRIISDKPALKYLAETYWQTRKIEKERKKLLKRTQS
ncbi:MAG: hypothetical protein ABH864_06375 [archaeon]